ncbi:MAG: cell division protein FtsX, partial [Minisyncoccales bacterium]
EEISVMKLVGASNWFVRGSFIVQGMICGIAASIVSMLFLYLACWGLNGKAQSLLGGFSLYSSFVSNFWILLGTQLILGLTLSSISSLIAVKRYLK